MAQQSDERISSLVDGEFDGQDPHAAVEALLKDEEARGRWARYHLMSDAMKRNLPNGIDQQLSSRVMAALENEPTVLAPPKREFSDLGRRLSGLAVAASVAVVAVFGVQLMNQEAYQENGQASVSQVAQASAKSQVSAKNQALAQAQLSTQRSIQNNLVRPDMRPGVQTVTQSQRQSDPHAAIRKHSYSYLNKYLIDHNQQTARAIQGVVPYARIIAYPDQYHSVRQSQK